MATLSEYYDDFQKQKKSLQQVNTEKWKTIQNLSSDLSETLLLRVNLNLNKIWKNHKSLESQCSKLELRTSKFLRTHNNAATSLSKFQKEFNGLSSFVEWSTEVEKKLTLIQKNLAVIEKSKK
ncbi:hypothetical protein M0813_01117 [Anaeramoeba flamelloides]|uniref:Biogenesis of lysosome-related organelles complex 1 subunit 1 n=1 Tax=Anaeramoeba flamelloides TaxID=1746091 RepID=A0ABQ8X0V9_9EUKA|nr:hypothetical protein M0813_01117 [Anaeramoeba flamelloides]